MRGSRKMAHAALLWKTAQIIPESGKPKEALIL